MLKFNSMGEWARQQGLFKLRNTDAGFGVRGLIHLPFSTKRLWLVRLILVNVILSVCLKCSFDIILNKERGDRINYIELY